LAIRATLCVLSMAAAGCVTSTRYPAEWPAPAAVAPGTCPHIAGRYANGGVPAGDLCTQHEFVTTWNCDVDLSSNILTGRTGSLVDRGKGSRWVELAQPDDNRLLMSFDDGEPPITLKQSDHDFGCGNDGQTVSRWGTLTDTHDKAVSDIVGTTAVGFVIGTGGLANVSRTFQPLLDGSLLMTVRESSVGTFLYVPYYTTATEYVRWVRLPEPAEPSSPR
jgi:hypothetical protein